jgi:hypothetical protein
MLVTETVPGLLGLWRLQAFEGDLEYVENDRGVLVPANPCVFDSGVLKNLIVTVGKQAVLDRAFGLSSVTALDRTGVGTSGTAAAVGDTTLTGAVFKVFDSTATRASTTVTAATTFTTSEANINIQEMALANSANTLLNRIVIGPYNKTSAVSLKLTSQIIQA